MVRRAESLPREEVLPNWDELHLQSPWSVLCGASVDLLTLLTFMSFCSFVSTDVLHEPSLFIRRLGMCARLLHVRVFLSKSVTGPRIIAPPSTAATPPTMWAHSRHLINAPYRMWRKSSSYTSAAGVLGGEEGRMSKPMPKPEPKFNSNPAREWNTIFKKEKEEEKKNPKNKQYWPCGIFHDLFLFFCFFS